MIEEELVATVFDEDRCIVCQIHERELTQFVLDNDKLENGVYLVCEACEKGVPHDRQEIVQ